MARTGIDENRHEIASAACDLVASSGLDSVSMRRIAKHLGSTTGYISHYFEDKEDLLEAALRSALEDLTNNTGPRSTSMSEWIERAVGSLPHNPQTKRFWSVLTSFQAASLNNPRLAEILRVYVAEQEEALAVHLAGALEGAAPAAELTMLARSLFAMVSGLGTTTTTTPDAFTPAQHHAVVRFAVRGLLEEFAGHHPGVRLKDLDSPAPAAENRP